MQKRINLICAILALFCFISMYVPVIAPRYPADRFYAPAGNSAYFYTGDYYLAKNYWALTDLVFANLGILGRVILSLDQAVLLLWAWLSVRGETKRGLAITVVNLVVLAAAVILTLPASWACQWPVLVVMGLNAVAAVALAANASPK